MTLILECEKVVVNRKDGVEITTYRVQSSKSDDPVHIIPDNVTVLTHDSGRATITIGKQPIPGPVPPPAEVLPGLFPAEMRHRYADVSLKFVQANSGNPHSWNVFYNKIAVGFMSGPPPTRIFSEDDYKNWTCKIVLSEVKETIDRWTHKGSLIAARREFCKRVADVLASVVEVEENDTV